MDRYIDNSETQTYGPDLRENLRRRFGDDPRPAVRALVAWLIEAQAQADATMAEALHARRQTTGTLSTGAEARSPVVDAAYRGLRAFYKHLDAKQEADEWGGSVETFFPARLTGVRRGLRPLKTSLEVAAKALRADEGVPERAAWMRRLRGWQDDIDAAVTASGDAFTDARDALSEQGAEKLAWLRQYRGAALIAEGLLALEGAERELAAVVPHLATPDTRKAAVGATPADEEKR